MGINSYEELKKYANQGFGTYNNWSVTSYVKLPSGFAISLGFTGSPNGVHLAEPLIGRKEEDAEVVLPSYHAYDGSYTELTIVWRGSRYQVETANVENDIVILVKPMLTGEYKTPILTIEAAVLWGRDGYARKKEGNLTGVLPDEEISVYCTGKKASEPNTFLHTVHETVFLDEPVGVSTGKPRSVIEIEGILSANRTAFEASFERYGDEKEIYQAMQSCLIWNTIYDPTKDRIVSPVSRLWNRNGGGCVLFCWDTYFAAAIAGTVSRELAYSNAIEMTREITEEGFVPNFVNATGFKSRDRSQPPVGSWAIWTLYQKYQDKWLLEEAFDGLYTWNQWWFSHRQVLEGRFAWGSDFYEPVLGNFWEINHLHDRAGAALESGMDNSPMYDGVGYNPENHMLDLADVGLTSLILLDCQHLLKMAAVLKKEEEAAALQEKINRIEKNMLFFWNEEQGFYFNRFVDGRFNLRGSPTSFYPLYQKDLPQERISSMINRHFYNTEEYWGEYILPSVPRNDPAYSDNDYWRGRIWAPLNLLVYLGLKNHPENPDAVRAAAAMKEKSKTLLLKEWREHGHIHENYNADTGEGCDRHNSDKFYLWGGLLGYLVLDESHNLAGEDKDADTHRSNKLHDSNST